jgi:hypothetical protein
VDVDACWFVDAGECEERGCVSLWAWPVVTDESDGWCVDVDVREDVGCMPPDMGCDDSLGHGAPEGSAACWLFSSGCMPGGWDGGCADREMMTYDDCPD